jgi:ribosomal protein L12E/L44/L45/RPP1/RPP2
MKGTKVQAVAMVRRIRDRHAKALAGKSAAEVIAFYRAASAAATQVAAPSARRRTPANKALQPTSRAQREAKSKQRSRAPRG